MIKPIMSPATEQDVENALAQFKRKDLWTAWGLHLIRTQGPAILLTGPPGTGKTTIAKYMADKVKKGFKKLDVGNLACEGAPGEYEKNIQEFFEDCRRRHNCTIFMDECDHLLLARDQIGEAGKTWQLGGVEALMVNMNTYPGLVLAASNHPDMMDSAISDRFLAIIHVGVPDFEMRQRLWRQKMPKKFPLQFDSAQLRMISKIELTGRQIETVIINVASNAIRLGKRPTMTMFEIYAEKAKDQRLQ